MVDCAIIGAGSQGLSCSTPADRGLNVTVLEARDRVGGRLENKVLSDGAYVELGGQWIGPGFDALNEIIDDLGLETIGLPAKGNLVVRLRGQALEVPSSEDAPALTPFEVSDLGQGLLRLRRLAERLRDDAAWRKANDAWLGQDLRRWVSTNLRTQGAQRRFAEVYAAAFGPMPKGATLLEGLHQVNSGPDSESMLASNGGLHQKRVAGGMAAVAEGLAARLGDVVRLNAPVIRIGALRPVRRDSPGRRRGDRGQAGHLHLPPRLAVALEHQPALPAWRAEAADKVAAGNVIKAFLIYDRPFWRELGYSGQSSADEGAVRVTFDTTANDSERGHLMGFFEGADADSLSKRSVTLRERAFVDSVTRTFGEVARTPVAYIERDWAAEEFTGGCHGAHFAPGVWTTNGLRSPSPRASSTGPAPSMQPASTATWRAPCVPAVRSLPSWPATSPDPRHNGPMATVPLGRLRLVAQVLIDRPFERPADAVATFGAMQGQDLPGVIASAALRSTGRVSDVVADLDDGRIVRGYPMRGTVFFLPGADATWITELCAAPAIRASNARKGALGIDEAQVDRARTIASDLLVEPAARAELFALWDGAGLAPAGGRGYHLLGHLIMAGEVVYGPWNGTEQDVVLASTWLPEGRNLETRFNGDRDAATAELLRRYLTSHGPATIRDFAWWTKLTLAQIRRGLALLAGQLEHDDEDERSYWRPGLLDEAVALGRALAAPLRNTCCEEWR